MSISDTLGHSFNYLSTVSIADVVDILIVTYLIYQLILLIRRTNARNITLGVIVFALAYAAANFFGLTMISYILRKLIEIGVIVIVILFQPEIRRLLERLGSKLSSSAGADQGTDDAIRQTVIACEDMSASKTGALIIFERKMRMPDIIATGTVINSDVTAELLKNLFFNKAPLHDGAVIIREGRIAAAGCVLPLTKQTNISKDLGMRHRAGLGMSEEYDAIVVIVSEETGAISLAIDGLFKRHLSSHDLDSMLRKELIPKDSAQNRIGLIPKIQNLFKGLNDEK